MFKKIGFCADEGQSREPGKSVYEGIAAGLAYSKGRRDSIKG